MVSNFLEEISSLENSRNTFTSASLTMLKHLIVWIATKLWKILKEMVIPYHLICLQQNLYAGQEATVELDMEQQTGSKLGKEYVKVVYCHPGDLTYMQGTSWEMQG